MCYTFSAVVLPSLPDKHVVLLLLCPRILPFQPRNILKFASLGKFLSNKRDVNLLYYYYFYLFATVLKILYIFQSPYGKFMGSSVLISFNVTNLSSLQTLS